jgi:hypothetical protein
MRIRGTLLLGPRRLTIGERRHRRLALDRR